MARAASLAGVVAVTLAAGHGTAQDCSAPADQQAMTACAGMAFEAADAELNARYREVVARLSGNPEARDLLVQAQRAWIAFRDGECAFASAGVAGGSIHPMIVTSCRTRLTEARTADLEGYLACAEGDLACPLPPR